MRENDPIRHGHESPAGPQPTADVAAPRRRPGEGCPWEATVDQRKSAKLAAQHVEAAPGSATVRSFGLARELLRSAQVVQDGAGAEHVDMGNPEHVPVFFLDGEMHKRRRGAIKKFFTPQAVATRHRPVMEQTTDELLARLRAAGSARLDELTFELAVSVVSGIVGLTESDQVERSRRIATFLALTFNRDTGIKRLINQAKLVWYGYRFLSKDVRPAVAARRKMPRQDVLSQVIDKGYSERAMMIECITYATAGMITTREFIVMVAWYMFEQPELRARFLASQERDQLLILQEILRLRPKRATRRRSPM